MNFRNWFSLRGPEFIRNRAAVLLNRYGITPAKAQDRIDACVAALSKHGCAPTFPTPGRVVQRYSPYVRHLQDVGAEIAVHSYDHIDLAACRPAEASEQLMRGAQAFEQYGLEVHGFRCPYLRYTDDLLDVLPRGLFGYSSNQAIKWDVIPCADATNTGMVFDTINRFYQPKPALEAVCVPWTRANMVEIPVCVPDDLQLYDGLKQSPEGIAQIWCHMLDQIYQRGELFTLLFHPELALLLEQPFEKLLDKARQLQPIVWMARLRDIGDWWEEKSSFKVGIATTSTGLQLSFICSRRATILAKGFNHAELGQRWDGAYYRLQSSVLDVPANPRPFVGIAPGVPKRVVSFLQEQGYILDTGETAAQCAIYLDTPALTKLASEVKLVDHIETSSGPLVRYGRWPNGAKSALCLTGDLDALTLLDYASRLFAR